jgi:hypothetical protein
MELIKNQLKKLRTKFNFLINVGSLDVSEIIIENIPKKLECFLGSDDHWVSLDSVSDNTGYSSALYIGEKDSEFGAHKHDGNSEQLTIINPEGKLRVITLDDDFILCYPNSCLIQKGMPHYVYFIEKTSVICVWNPAFDEGWSAKIPNNLN